MSSQLREVNLDRNNNQKMMTKGEIRDLDEKGEMLKYINNVAALLQHHNDQITPIVQSYKARQNGGI